MANLNNEKKIDFEQLEKLASLFPTLKEASFVMNVSDRTLERKIKTKYKKTWEQFLDTFSSNTKLSIRRTQLKVALEDKNPTMLIHLGKIHLGQNIATKIETPEVKNEKVEVVISYEDTHKNTKKASRSTE